MKKTVLDGKQWILDLLLKAGINNVISGKIYKDKRPADSQKEDIVINSLTMTNHFLQNGVFNVNCYVPKKLVKIQDKNQYHTDYARMKHIVDLVYPVLTDVWEEDFNLNVVSQQHFEEEKEDYYNFRVEINAYPDKN